MVLKFWDSSQYKNKIAKRKLVAQLCCFKSQKNAKAKT